MRSRLFQTFDLDAPENDAFHRDVEVLAALPEDQLPAFLHAVPRLSALATDSEQLQLIDEVTGSTSRSPVDVAYILRALQLFLTGFLDEKTASDAPADIAADLVEANILDREPAANLERLLAHVRTYAPQSRAVFEASTAVHRVLPNITGFHTSVELRAILEREYEAGTPVAEYQPAIRDAVPIVSVRLTMDSGPAQDVCFQLTKNGARRIADALHAAAMTLDAFEKQFRETAEAAKGRAASATGAESS
jgi:hypothetical protein